MGRLARGASYVLVLVVCGELAVWGAFLTGSRPWGHPLPVSALIALVGNVVIGFVGARVLARPLGAVLPAVLWVVVAVALAVRLPSGSLVVVDSWRGRLFLLVGAVAWTVPIALSRASRGVRATPEAPDGR